MNFRDAFRRQSDQTGGPVISFEVFPPRTEKSLATFGRILPRLATLKPDFVTVTYGALGSTRDKTIDIARSVKADWNIETACHLTCVGSTSDDIDAILDQIHAANIQNLSLIHI